PIANDDTADGDTDSFADTHQITGYALTNDNDPDGDYISVTKVNGVTSNVGVPVQGTYGTLQMQSNGSYTYTVDPNDPDTLALQGEQIFTEQFTYTISDQTGATDEGAVAVQAPVSRMRPQIIIAAGIYYKNQNPQVLMMVTIITPTPNRQVTLSVDNMTGQVVPYYETAQGEAGGPLRQQNANPITSGANRRITVWIPVDSIDGTGAHRWWAVCPGTNFLPSNSADNWILRVP
ncbi:MAG: Ig-like domain-containing protein, partial [Gemmataceae bacterium]|nr:Ig-like domain-containing protein [Gemmataceae bacterium]